MARALIGLGANLGDRRQTLDAAVERLAALPETRVVACSEWLENPPIGGPPGQSAFLNGAALLTTSIMPAALHAQLHAIESALGRQRSRRWEARQLDLDLLLYDSLVIYTSSLQVPHPGLVYRRFVLEPAAAVASRMVHPLLGWTISELLAHLNLAPNYVALAGGSYRQRAEFAARLAQLSGATCLSVADVEDGPAAEGCWQASLDPPVQHLARGIEFLTAMERSLAVVSSATAKSYVSDFWWEAFPTRLGQLPVRERQELLAAWREASANVPRTKLVASLGGVSSVFDRGPYLTINPQGELSVQLDEAAAAMQAMR